MDFKMYSETEVIITGECPFCGIVSEVVIPVDGFMAWQNGSLIQDAFPTLPAKSREFLISGMCRDCQEKIFG